jgi:type II secretory pathway pseudopilin PulG
MNFARHAPAATKAAGFAYLGLLIAIAIMGLVQASLAAGWHADARREKERELLFAGNQIRQALNLYYAHSPAKAPRHPLQLEDLLLDPRTPTHERYLRKVYPDPITGKAEWGIIRGAGGEIHGVHSLSDRQPLKQGGFARADKNFSGAQQYSEWVFMAGPGLSFAAAAPPH